MDTFIILSSFEEANSLNINITNLLKSNWKDGVTSTYCEIKKHPKKELYAVVIDKNYKNLFTEEQINSSIELSEDWFEVIIN
jgi:hypothetical protein